MKHFIKRFLSTILAVGFLCATPAMAATNIPGDVGEYGTWLTEHNVTEFHTNVSTDLMQYQANVPNPQLVQDYVPIEAKLGLAFMNAMSYLAEILDNSLVRFTIIFMIIAYAFWSMFEIYQMMTAGKGTNDLAEKLVKKGVTIAIWIAILGIGPAKLFIMVMGPIVSVGTYLSDLILGGIANTAGANLPDTCAAIREYAVAHTSDKMLMDAEGAANILCVPTRLSGFFYTAVAVGWKWMLVGLGSSAFTFLMGAVFVVLFAYNIWKFAIMAFGVIADLFLAVLMLPFTALTETMGKTSYKGIAGDIFNGFLGLFKSESLQAQIMRFINAALYFVSMSIVIALCAGLLSGVVDTNLSSTVPSLDNGEFFVTFLTGCLVAYLASRADEIAKDIGGDIKTDMGDKFAKDATGLAKSAWGQGKKWWKIIRKGGK